MATDFSLHITSLDGETAWALCVDDGTGQAPVHSARSADADRDRIAELAVVTAADHLTAIGGYEADLLVFDTRARTHLLELGGQFGPIRVLPRSMMKYPEGWDRLGWQVSRDLAYGLSPDQRARIDQQGFILAATDGSFSKSTGATCAWIREDGRYGMHTLDRGAVLEAELFGIRQLLTSATPGEKLRVFVDSKAALSAIERDVGDGRSRYTNHAEDLARSVRKLMERVEVSFEWVKSHNGHPLNDGADRLAVLARRTRELPASRDQVARRIVDEVLTNHNQKEAA